VAGGHVTASETTRIVDTASRAGPAVKPDATGRAGIVTSGD
jgi:hypothetical protein